MQTLLKKINSIQIRQKDKAIRIDNLYKIRQRCNDGALTSGASAKLVVRLERATGVSRLKWMFPKEYGNPFDEYFKAEKSLAR